MSLYRFCESGKRDWFSELEYDDDPSGTDPDGNTLHEVTSVTLRNALAGSGLNLVILEDDLEVASYDLSPDKVEQTFNVPPPQRFPVVRLVPNVFDGGTRPAFNIGFKAIGRET